jgi:hypothetical protein
MGSEYETAKVAEVSQPQSLKATTVLHNLINQLEDKLLPVLRPSNNSAKDAASPEPVKSEIMQELGYLQNRINSLIERIHV